MIHVEYLALFQRADSFCDTSASFERLLQVDSNITIRGGKIHHRDISCEVTIACGTVKGRNQRYFHIRLCWDATLPGAAASEVEKFMGLLRALRATVALGGGDTEILRDDISAHYAAVAYPLIYEIETLMRRLIATFMLITVGREWVSETVPKPLQPAVKKGQERHDTGAAGTATRGEKDYLGVLHKVDFIHLSEFLFTKYPNKSTAELEARVSDMQRAKTLEEAVDGLQQYIPQSNWSRYFKGVVDCEDTYINLRWQQLYDLRCKVAHNTMVSRTDLEKISRLVDEVRPKLQNAIAKISGVTVPPEEIELVAEHAAGSTNAALGEFISNWQAFEAALSPAPAPGAPPAVRRIHLGQDLVRSGALPSDRARTYDELRTFRNRVVHGPIADVPPELLQRQVIRLQALRNSLRTIPYINHLRTLAPDELDAEIDERIAETKDDIVDAEAFCSAMAGTNASGYSVEEYDVKSIKVEDDHCMVSLTYSATGEQADEKMYCGSEIRGTAVAVIDDTRGVEYRDVTATVFDADG